MNKIFNRQGYNFKEDLESGLIAIFWIAVIVLALYSAMALLDHIDQYKIDAHVIQVQALDEQIVAFEDEDGNVWDEYFDYEREVHCGDKAVLTIKECETVNVSDDIVVNVKWVE